MGGVYARPGPGPGEEGLASRPVSLRLLFANTFLLRIPLTGPLARFGHLHAKPAVRPRAREYGAVLPDYDVVALCEVFRADDLDAMVDAWAGSGLPEIVVGPGHAAPSSRVGSGLVTLSAGPEVVGSRGTVFSDQGSRWRDSDAWSSKGALVTEIDLPGTAANLEVTSTHLIAGGDLANTARHRARTEEVRFAQVETVLAAAEDAHRHGNVALIVGDFNVPAGSAAGERLQEVMAAAGYRDLWLDHGDGPGWTSDVMTLPELLTTADPDDDRFCADPAPGHPDAQRIDYAFLRRPRDGEPTVQVDAMRRRAFRRDRRDPEAAIMPFLSDHLALHLELAIDPGSSSSQKDQM